MAPRPALFFQAVGDSLVVATPNDQLARAFGADLARPIDHAVPGMRELALPATGNFVWQEDWEGATRLLVHAPMNDFDAADRHGALVFTPYAQEMVAHCFRTLLADGACEAIDTRWADY